MIILNPGILKLMISEQEGLTVVMFNELNGEVVFPNYTWVVCYGRASIQIIVISIVLFTNDSLLL